MPQLQRHVSEYLAQRGSHGGVDAALVTAGHVGLDADLQAQGHARAPSELRPKHSRAPQTRIRQGGSWEVSMAQQVAMVTSKKQGASSLFPLPPKVTV